MPRIPDEMSLGERTQPQVGAPRYESSNIRGPALAQAAQQIGAAVERYAQQDDAFNYARAKSALQSADVAVRAKLAEDPEWHTHEAKYAEEMRQARERSAKMIKGGRSRALFDADVDVDIQRGTEYVRGQAKQIEGQWGRSRLDEMLAANRVAALEAKDPATRDALVTGVFDGINGAVMNRYITPEQAVAARQAWVSEYGEGWVTMLDDAGAMKALKNPKGTPAEYVDPAKRAALLERLVDKQRVAADRREAKAERAVAQWERHISSGVPMSDDIRKELSALIRGTSVEGELDTLLAGEREVQGVLRMPIAEQARYVQDKRAALMKTGGSLADAANVQRLETAVTKNVELLRTNPLLFAEQRLGTTTAPLEIGDIMEPDQQYKTSVALRERAAALRAVERRFGERVPLRPLLPQEAEQLVFAIDKASPMQTAQFFGALRNAAGSDDIFRGAMGQIAADSPVKAIAGLLAGHERRGADGRSSAEVASMLLQGERIMNPSKAAKGADGKPQSKNLYLPEGVTLQDEFVDVVGNAFVGRPQAADAALQAARAYYVGRAAQTGRLAADRDDIDMNLVREAVESTVGEVVDYNNNGAVIAPWGMTEDQFEDRVQARVNAVMDKRGFKDVPTSFWSDYGLTNAGGDGEYAVTVGKNLLLDAEGNPIIIDVGRADPRDARGFITR